MCAFFAHVVQIGLTWSKYNYQMVCSLDVASLVVKEIAVSQLYLCAYN